MSAALPAGVILANNHRSELLRSSISREFQVTRIICNVPERRIDLQWSVGSGIWLSRDYLQGRVYRSGNRDVYSALQYLTERATRQRHPNIYVPIKPVQVNGSLEHFAVIAYGSIYLIPGTPLSDLFAVNCSVDEISDDDILRYFILMEAISSVGDNSAFSLEFAVQRFFKQLEGHIPPKWLEGQQVLVTAISTMPPPLRIFDPLSWTQRDNPEPPYV